MADRREYLNQYYKDKLKRVAFNIPKERHAELKAWCRDHDTTMQGLIKELLEDKTGISFNMKESE